MAVYKSDKKTKDGRCWYFRSYKKDSLGNNKQYESKMYKTKSECENAERIFLLENGFTNNETFDIVAMSYFDNFTKTNKSSSKQSYLYDYNKHLKPFLGHLKIKNINLNTIRLWHDYMDEKGLSTSFKNKVNSVLRNILNYAMCYYDLNNNYAQLYGRFQDNKEAIKEDKKLNYLTLEEFNQFVSVIDDTLYKNFFNFLFFTGCRKSEAFCLLWTDLDFNSDMISITKTMTRNGPTSTKNNQNRKIKMNKSLRNDLLAYKEYRKSFDDFSESEYVFGACFPLSRTTVDRYKDKYIQLSGCKYFSCHTLRHSAVTLLVNEMLKQNTNTPVDRILFQLSVRFGHTPEVMIKTYAHLYEDKIQDNVVDILDNL